MYLSRTSQPPILTPRIHFWPGLARGVSTSCFASLVAEVFSEEKDAFAEVVEVEDTGMTGDVVW